MSLGGSGVAASGVDRHGLWVRRSAALAAAAVAAAGAGIAAVRMPLDAMDSGAVDLAGWLLTGALLLSSRTWYPRRRARLVWQVRVAGLHGFEPGLVARRSAAGWAGPLTEVAGAALLSLALLASLPDQGWSRVVRIVIAVGIAAFAGRVVYDMARFSGALALTASGIRQERRWHDWSNIDQARLHRTKGRVDGVYLRPKVWLPTKHERRVGGRTTAVPDERLLAAIDHFRSRPEVLAVGLPVTAPGPAPARH
ncbi:hypothetical protein [Micromonospora sp. WMMD812]|uniref:hypothetical protein n=1 Tax=Micromonospora sp. WMMD812 TaxID=3015152 RepID=UPI00248BC61C|nr:hypothetical protein [Micromonospora sp. WMMD812]WBB65160.1 hypothetical protein O7603_18250 [Micromonospora sp. WMMD812]